jgi:hypothetical protein
MGYIVLLINDTTTLLTLFHLVTVSCLMSDQSLGYQELEVAVLCYVYV